MSLSEERKLGFSIHLGSSQKPDLSAPSQAAFASEFATDLGDSIEEVVVGSGPCGELRYPSYLEANGWRFPGVSVCFSMLCSCHRPSCACGSMAAQCVLFDGDTWTASIAEKLTPAPKTTHVLLSTRLPTQCPPSVGV